MAIRIDDEYEGGYDDWGEQDRRRRALLSEMESGPAAVADPEPSPPPSPAPSTGPLPPSAVPSEDLARQPGGRPPIADPPGAPPPPVYTPLPPEPAPAPTYAPPPAPAAPPPINTYPEARNTGITPAPPAPPVIQTPNPQIAPTATPGVMPGWDAAKWADPTHQTTKYEVGRILAKYPPTVQGLQQAMAEIAARFPRASLAGNDRITGLPGTQGPVDVLEGADRGGRAWWWGDTGASASGGATAAGPATAPASPAMLGGDTRRVDLGGVRFDPRQGYQFGYTGQLPPEIAQFYSAQTQAIQRQQEQQQQVQASMRDALLRLMAQGQEPVDVANDKTLGPASAAYRNAQRREGKQGREALAERAAFMGLNSGGQGSGAFDSALQGQEENIRNAIASYEGQLAMSELQNRRGLLVQALQIANALGARTEATDLSKDLAALDRELQYSRLGQQQSQFEDSMGFNWGNLQYQMNRDALLAGMEG